MKKFKFQLDTVLRYKGQVLDTRLQEHGQVLAQVHRQEDVLEEARGNLWDYLEEYREKQAAGMTVVDAMKCWKELCSGKRKSSGGCGSWKKKNGRGWWRPNRKPPLWSGSKR